MINHKTSIYVVLEALFVPSLHACFIKVAFTMNLSGQMYLGMERVNLTELGSAIGSEKALLSGRLSRLEYWQQMNLGKSTNGQLQFVGEGFLKHQVRRMVGLLVRIGLGKEGEPEAVRAALDEPATFDRRRAPTAPAEGLWLESVQLR